MKKPAAVVPTADSALEKLCPFVRQSRRLTVLTGAGCSTGSGIPDYRDSQGEWKRKMPVRFQEFIRSEPTRRRYWGRALIGWPLVARARPNRAHTALARLEKSGWLHATITQNVDGLHQAAGSREVIDLHGRLDRVVCLDCGRRSSRDLFQQQLLARNPGWSDLFAGAAPDGDVDLEIDFSAFQLVECEECGGVIKPDVVFFGEGVPKARVARAMEQVLSSDALLVVGSSLMVWSGYRFVRAACEQEIPVAAVNLGRTRADGLLQVKVEDRCEDVLHRLSQSVDDLASRGV